jgi:antitoxin ParD1/3/4
MGFIRKNITLTELQDSSVKTQVDEVHNSNDRGCSAEMESIRTALIQGEASGEAKYFDAESFKRRMRATPQSNKLEDLELNTIADSRANHLVIKVSLDDL